jgi:hypothetical protein
LGRGVCEGRGERFRHTGRSLFWAFVRSNGVPDKKAKSRKVMVVAAEIRLNLARRINPLAGWVVGGGGQLCD